MPPCPYGTRKGGGIRHYHYSTTASVMSILGCLLFCLAERISLAGCHKTRVSPYTVVARIAITAICYS